MSVIVDGKVKLTYEDFRRIPDDRCSHELIDGEHFMAPAPGTYHQSVLGHLHFQLYAQIELAGQGRVFCAPVDVQLSEFDIVEPDIVAIVAGRQAIIRPTRIIGTPDFVVEILSPHTRRKDRELKRALYERHGVPVYWLVDPVRRSVTVYRLDGGVYNEFGPYSDRLALAAPGLAATVDLTKAWDDPAAAAT